MQPSICLFVIYTQILKNSLRDKLAKLNTMRMAEFYDIKIHLLKEYNSLHSSKWTFNFLRHLRAFLALFDNANFH